MPSYKGKQPVWETVHCADGFNMSVQANQRAYCNPRSNTGPWDEVEVGYPSAYEYCLQPYAEDPNRPTETVYGYVPSKLVHSIIETHGGLVSGEVPPMPVCQTNVNIEE